MSQKTDLKPSRLAWVGVEEVDAAISEALYGPGAPFETRVEQVAGYEREIFVRQQPDLRRYLDDAIAMRPDEVFLAEGDEEWSYLQARDEIDRIAVELAERYGIRPGDRVAIVAANSAPYCLTFWAVSSLGAIVTSLNGWWTGPEMLYGIELTQPKLILGDDRRLERLTGSGADLDQPIVNLEELRRNSLEQEEASFEPVRSEPDDPAVILFTSGTTGKPKGATLSHRNVLHFAWANMAMGALKAATGAAPADPSAEQKGAILSSPLFHVSGLVALVLTGPGFGFKLVLPSPGRWDETEYLDLTEKHRVATWGGVPTQFIRLMRHPRLDEYDLSSVATIGGGGAPFPPDLVREIQRNLPDVTISTGYGMSESVGLGTRVAGDAMAAATGAVGQANITVAIEVRDPLGNVVPEGTVGEIHMNTAALFLGYWANEEATADSMDADGWYRSGDYGRIEDGQLLLESRMRDLIIRGGENVYPIEVEHCLIDHPDIDDAAVIGVDHEELGQEVKAFVVLRQGSTMSADEVRRWAGEHLARFKVPAHVEFRDALPYTDTGKVLKHLLEDEESSKATA